jgi:hypothetical protein
MTFSISSLVSPLDPYQPSSFAVELDMGVSPMRHGFAPGFVNYKKGAVDSQSQVIKFTSCLPMVDCSLLLLLPLRLVAMIDWLVRVAR